MRDRARLPAGPAADDLDRDVELALRARDAKRREGCHLEDTPAQVGERVLLVDGDAAFTRGQSDARDGVLAPPGASIQVVSQSSNFLLHRRSGPSVSVPRGRAPRPRRREGASAYRLPTCSVAACRARRSSPGTSDPALGPSRACACAGRLGSPSTACTPWSAACCL